MLAVLPILRRLAFRRGEAANIHKVLGAQFLDGFPHLIGFALEQRALREKHLVRDAERGQIVANQVHHHGDGLCAHFGQPSRLFHAQEPLAVFLR